jgi:hypothetical protein
MNELSSIVHITIFNVYVFIFLSIHNNILLYSVYHKYCGWSV